MSATKNCLLAVVLLYFSSIGLNDVCASTLRKYIDNNSKTLTRLPVNLVQNPNNPQSAEDYYERARIHRKFGRQQEAFADLERAIKLDPTLDRTYYYERALNYYQFRKTDKALEDLKAAIEIDSQYAEAYCVRGRIYYDLRKTNEALENFNLCHKLKPDVFSYGDYWQRGILHSKVEETEKALGDYTKSLELAPSFSLALQNRAILYRRLGDNEKAIADYTRVIESTQNPSSSHYNRGVIYQELGQIAKAIADFDKVINIETKFFQPYSESGQINRTTIERAIENFGTKTEPSNFNSHFYQAYLNRGVIHGKLGATKQALADYERAISINPEFAEAYLERGRVHCALGNITRSAKDWKQAKNLSQQQENSQTYREVEQLSSDRCPKPLESYTDSIVRSITNPPLSSVFAYIQRGKDYVRSKELEKALIDFDEAISLDRDFAVPYYHRGTAYLKLGETKKAFVDFDRAIAIAPNYVNIYVIRGIFYTESRELEKALAEFNRAIEINPNYVINYFNYGSLYYDSGRIDLAYASRGKVHAQLKETQKALADYDRAISFGQIKNPYIFYERSLLHKKLENISQCRKDLETARSMFKKQGNIPVYLKVQKSIELNFCTS